MDIYNLISFSGIFVFLAVAWCLSSQRRNVNWHVIGWGVLHQRIHSAGRIVMFVRSLDD